MDIAFVGNDGAVQEFHRFARRYEVLVIGICHPSKMGGDGKGANKPTLYGISGSAHWFDKSDTGIAERGDLAFAVALARSRWM